MPQRQPGPSWFSRRGGDLGQHIAHRAPGTCFGTCSVVKKGGVLGKATISKVCTPLGSRCAIIHLVLPPGVSISPIVLEATLILISK